jgi:P-type Mg2+ transporter
VTRQPSPSGGTHEVQAPGDLSFDPAGLSPGQARERLGRYGPNLLKRRKRSGPLSLFLAQFKSPLLLLLILAAGLSVALHDATDAAIILAIILTSGLLGFWQEHRATNAVEKMLAMVEIKTTVLRDGREQDVPVENIVPGDIVVLRAGDTIPADCITLEAKDLFVDEATLTGETFPVEKGDVAAAASLPEASPLPVLAGTLPSGPDKSLFMGTHVVSGGARAVVVQTGPSTQFGSISEHLRNRPEETEFEHGVRHFGYLLIEVTLILVIAIFAVNVYRARPVFEAFLFSLALAVGLTPQLLPAIISINLAHGARRMAREKVIVKRLASIENFGSMDVLCSDKTGTLTEGEVHVQSAVGIDGAASEKVLLYAYVNSAFETGFADPLDKAICTYRALDLSGYQKLDEVPFDFVRKRLSILVSKDDRHVIVTKGALANVLAICSKAEDARGDVGDIADVRDQTRSIFEQASSEGFRVLGVAYRDVGATAAITRDHEADMTFLGFVILFDPPKAGVKDTIGGLEKLGISLKIITGDNRLVAASVSRSVGLADASILTGDELHRISDEALRQRVGSVDVFAEVEPNQKERIILALRKSGRVVGYMGDGINDASALHAADVGISVESAVDVAKESADIVLLEKDLAVLCHGVEEGRRTFANTLKYVFMATSANFGNMFSMAGVSLILPFLPLLPKQILLTNVLTDIPEMTISTDSVDPETAAKPRRWNIGFIRKFMITFGLLSSIFDYLMFGALFLMRASPTEFRTGWFLESVVSAAVVVLAMRTRRSIFRSRPSNYLLGATLAVVASTILLTFTPLGSIFGFKPPRAGLLALIAGIVALYVAAAEIAKRLFYKFVRS